MIESLITRTVNHFHILRSQLLPYHLEAIHAYDAVWHPVTQIQYYIFSTNKPSSACDHNYRDCFKKDYSSLFKDIAYEEFSPVVNVGI